MLLLLTTMTPTGRSIPELPTELILVILSYLRRRDSTALLSCSLVSRSWRSISLPLIFHTVKIQCQRDVVRWNTRLRKMPLLKDFIKVLLLRDYTGALQPLRETSTPSWIEKPDVNSFFATLSGSGSLKEVIMREMPTLYSRRGCSNLIRGFTSPPLDTLRLEHQPISATSLFEIVTAFSPHHFHLKDVTIFTTFRPKISLGEELCSLHTKHIYNHPAAQPVVLRRLKITHQTNSEYLPGLLTWLSQPQFNYSLLTHLCFGWTYSTTESRMCFTNSAGRAVTFLRTIAPTVEYLDLYFKSAFSPEHDPWLGTSLLFHLVDPH